MRTFVELKAASSAALDKRDFELMLSIAEEFHQLGTLEGLGAEAINRGTVFFYTGEIDRSLEWNNKALAIYVQLGDLRNQARVEVNLGNSYSSKGELDAGLAHYQHALSEFEELDDTYGKIRATNNIANIYRSMSMYSDALRWYDRTRGILEQTDDAPSMANLEASIGIVYVYTGSYVEAIRSFERALEIYDHIGDVGGAASVFNSIGDIYLSSKSYSEALVWFQKSIEKSKERAHTNSQALVNSNIGEVYAGLGDLAKAVTYFELSLTTLNNLGSIDTIEFPLSALGNTLIDLSDMEGAVRILHQFDMIDFEQPKAIIMREMLRARIQSVEGDLNAAISTYTQALAQVQTHGLRPEEAEIRLKLRDLAQKSNDFAAYIEHNNEYNRVSEDIRGRDASMKMAIHTSEKQIRVEREEREREKAILYGALPKHIADRMIKGEDVSGDLHDATSVLFLDIAGFTTISDQYSPSEVVLILERVFATVDTACVRNNITKIKTIGDAYLAVGFQR